MIDSHAHLNDEKFSLDLEEVLARARLAGVKAVINVGYDLESSKRAVELAEEHLDLYAVVGVHPHDAQTCTPAILDHIRQLLEHPKVVAIGETGLDYYYDNSPREIQRAVFRDHLSLAREVKKPVVIHSREAAQDTLQIVQDYPDVSCLLHCYSGSWEMAQEYKKLGHYFSFGGPITFSNAHKLRAVAAKIPLERVMLETDCPYLTPHPHRGKRNEPAYLVHTAEKLASIHGVDVEDVVSITEDNTRRFFAMNEGG
ncbi:MAG: TatD family hydrolase [Firmicutes bacterium]|nr:TatD family hydrolase [Bacillota bacterium]